MTGAVDSATVIPLRGWTPSGIVSGVVEPVVGILGVLLRVLGQLADDCTRPQMVVGWQLAAAGRADGRVLPLGRRHGRPSATFKVTSARVTSRLIQSRINMPKAKSKAKTSQEKMQGEVVLGHIELNGQGSQPSHKSGKSGRAEDSTPSSAKKV